MFTFNGISASTMGLGVTGVRRSILPTVNHSTQEVPGMAGAFLMNSNVGARRIEVDVYFVGTPNTPLEALEDVMEQTHDIAAWLFTQSPLALSFDDEPDKVYYAMLDGDTDLDVVADYRAGTLTFICHDPYAYADTPDQFNIVAGEATITNDGTVDTFAVIEATVDGETSFVEAVCAETGEFVRVGAPIAVGATLQTPQEVVFNDDCSEMDWTPTTYVYPGIPGGALAKLPNDAENPMVMDTDGTAFSPLVEDGDFGTGAAWHGPAVLRAATGDPVQDFYFRAMVQMAGPVSAVGRFDFTLLNSSDEPIAWLWYTDSWPTLLQTKWGCRLGDSPTGGHTMVGSGPASNTAFNNATARIRMTRIGTVFTASILRYVPSLGRFTTYQTVTFNDVAEAYADAVAKVVVGMSVFGEYDYPTTLKLHNIELNRYAADINYPAIAAAGDELTFDMRQGVVLLNGEDGSLQTDASGNPLPLSSLVDYGSTFFTVPTGDSTLEVLADDGVGVTGTVSIQKRWL